LWYGHIETLSYVCMHFVLYDIYIYTYVYICVWYIYILFICRLCSSSMICTYDYIYMVICKSALKMETAIGIGASSHGSQVITIASRLGWRSPWVFASENIWNLWNNHGLFHGETINIS
jgi:hypothetical protein